MSVRGQGPRWFADHVFVAGGLDHGERIIKTQRSYSDAKANPAKPLQTEQRDRAVNAPDTPFVWVIVLNWNAADLTIRSLAGLARTQWQSFGVCLCDNGSSDESVERIVEWVQAGSTWFDTGCSMVEDAFDGVPIRPFCLEGEEHTAPNAIPLRIILNGRNLGFSAGNNPGLQMARDDGAAYAWLLNNDALPHPDSLSAMVALAEDDVRVGIVGGVIRDLDDMQRVQCWGGGQVNMWTGIPRALTAPHAMGDKHFICGGNMLVRCSTIGDVGLLDEEMFLYWDDSDLSFRAWREGWRLAVANNAVVWHELSATTGKNQGRRDYFMNRSAIRFFSKFSPIPFVPLTISFTARMLKRLLRADWDGVIALMSAAGIVLPRKQWRIEPWV